MIDDRHPAHAYDVAAPHAGLELERVAVDLLHLTLAVRSERSENVDIEEREIVPETGIETDASRGNAAEPVC